MNPRTRRLLQGAIVPTLLLMAWPNILVMTAQASTGLIETWWVSRLGTDALAGMALVFPGFMMMQMLSAGAIGGGISSAVARALGAGRRDDADALVLHAILVNLGLGVVTSAIFLAFGRPIYAAMGGEGGSLEAALAYSNVVFAGNVLVWLMNALGQRDPRHRQHARAGARRLPRRRAADAALAAASSSAGARCRRSASPAAARGRHHDGAHRRRARLVHPRPAAASCGCAGRACSGRSSPTSCASAASARSARCRPR